MIPQLELWQGGTGDWHVSNTQNLAKNHGSYLYIARRLGFAPAKYLELVFSYKPDIFRHNDDFTFFSFSWSNKANAAKFKNDINKKLRESLDKPH